MKPDWKDAPEWARYLTKDTYGKYMWHEKEPELILGMFWKSPQGSAQAEPVGEFKSACIERRPNGHR